MDWGDIITGLIAACPGVLTAFVLIRKSKAEQRKTEADAATQIQDAALELITPLRDELGIMRGELNHLKKVHTRAMTRIAYLMGGIAMLTQQITQRGEEPVWRPDDWREECD